ncbi:MAG: hypothetical protein KDC55_02410 [Ignavibacteriae bacterium]|nr:hypothetical protein [Ignavibacteriota bacterium]MCB9221718.1 hypothetical protein [Ignavibacteria bacterium]
MNKTIYIVVFCTILLLLGCKNDTTNNSPVKENVTLKVTINHKFGQENVVPEVSVHTNSSGNEIKFTKLHYIMTNFVLVDSEGNELKIDSSAAYINMTEGRVDFELGNIPEGNYSELKFYLGVDSVTNHQNPNSFSANSPLNPITNNLYWDWMDGFIFCSIEGYHFKESEPKGAFAYHIGLDENLMIISIKDDFEVRKDKSLELVFDLSAYFEYPYVINISENAPITHSDKAADFGLSSKLSKNLLNAFRIDGDEE